MSADRYPASIVSQLAITGSHRVPKGYYRSKIFVTSSTTNPLVAAASPLLSLLERLGLSPTLPTIDHIRDNIEHELFAFHSRLAGQEYAQEFVVIADYLLSATVDELIGKNYLRLYDKPAEFKAFTPISQDNTRPEHRFFEIVNYIKQRTNQYLDLLELAYYCLITGFEGEHHLRADGRQVLDNLIEELHQIIQQHRVHKPHRLFKENITSTPEPVNHNSIIINAVIALTVIIAVYIGSNMLLDNKAKSLLFDQSRGTEWINH